MQMQVMMVRALPVRVSETALRMLQPGKIPREVLLQQKRMDKLRLITKRRYAHMHDELL